MTELYFFPFLTKTKNNIRIRQAARHKPMSCDGTFPIMLRVNWKGMKEKSTGYSCSAKYWDKVNQCVKKG